MRKLLFLLTLVLAACGGNGDGPKPAPEPVAHVPGINSVTLSQENASYMDGNGGVVVTAEIEFWDFGLDIQTLQILVPDGTTLEYDQALATETGVFFQDITIPTVALWESTLEFRLLDQAGNISRPRYADFSVTWQAPASDWVSRLSGLPYVLDDVIWDGSVFVAVGRDGAILTSADGVDWVERDSGTNVSLNAVAAHGQDIIAVGEEFVLLSTDHGENWTIKGTFVDVDLATVAANASTILIGGNRTDTESPLTTLIISEDGGDTWQTVDWLLYETTLFRDFLYGDGVFVAAAETWDFWPAGQVFVSTDGRVWNEIFGTEAGLKTAVHAGGQFFVAGQNDNVCSSFDGFNWTQMQTPGGGVDFMSAAAGDSTLVLAGGRLCVPVFYDDVCPQDTDQPDGMISTDGGLTWELFVFAGEYQSFGLAFGNGRFVSVGEMAPDSDEGAIYTYTAD